MNRIHLFEFTDLTWYPQTFRRMQTDYLQFAAGMGAGHQNLIPLFARAMQNASTTQIIDLCSGSGGPWRHLQEQLKQAGLPATVTLTDQFPDPVTVQKWASAGHQDIHYLPTPVDALHLPPHLSGMRTLFEGFHHFRPIQARLILQDAFQNRSPIGIFEARLKPPFGLPLLVLSPIITLLTYLLITPFMKPLYPARLLWTYLLPIVPLATCWDGIVSLLRVYSPADLQALTAPLQRADYVWETGLASTGTPIFDFAYLLGYPAKAKDP